MSHRDDDTLNASHSAEFRPEWSATGHLAEESIYAWLDGAFGSTDNITIDQHVQACTECRSAVAEARGFIAGAARIVGALDAVPRNVVPAHDVARTAAKIITIADAEASSRPTDSARRREEGDRMLNASMKPWYMRSTVRAAAAFVVMIGGVSYVVNQTRSGTAAPHTADSVAVTEPSAMVAPAPASRAAVATANSLDTNAPTVGVDAAHAGARRSAPVAQGVADASALQASALQASAPHSSALQASAPHASAPLAKSSQPSTAPAMAERPAVVASPENLPNPQARSLADKVVQKAEPKFGSNVAKTISQGRAAARGADTATLAAINVVAVEPAPRTALSFSTATVALPAAATDQAIAATSPAKAQATPAASPPPLNTRADSGVARDALNLAPKDVAEREKRDALSQLKKTTITAAATPMQTSRQSTSSVQSSVQLSGALAETSPSSARTTSASRTVTFVGTVTDGRRALFAATVSVGGESVRTDSTGHFVLRFMRRGVSIDTLPATVRADAFITQRRKFESARQDTIRMDFVLVRNRP